VSPRGLAILIVIVRLALFAVMPRCPTAVDAGERGAPAMSV
jgi:hypothetical protein